MGKLFGTDGIRGVANEYPMTAEMGVRIGKAAALFFKKNRNQSKIVIGKDTRISGDMLENAITSGICSMGVDVYAIDVFPTPGVAYITVTTGADAGMVVSASHNPFYDNGIKFFRGDGYKLSDQEEIQLEQLVLKDSITHLSESVRETGKRYNIDDAQERYEAFIRRSVTEENFLKGMKIIVDCSNGATYRIAPKLFAGLGADVEVLSAEPDGKNINDGCGSQHTDELRRKIKDMGADIGFAFDGDGDRMIAADEFGNIVTGDQVLAICANYLKKTGRLRNNVLVSTVMSNMGLKITLNKMGITHVQANVGDRYVLEKMIATGAVLGGEDSGHLIFLDHHRTGDGLLAAMKLIEAVKAEAKPLSELAGVMPVFPQILLNVEVKSKPDMETVPSIREAIRAVETSLGQEGRVLVRYSGTQSICRVMVEGPTPEDTQQYCNDIAEVIERELG